MTSPVAMIWILCLLAYSLAFFNINILQSLHGLIPAPAPYFGDFRILRYSERRGSLWTSRIFKLIGSL